jgi:acyl-coenzyme A thioesterase PaaI-like protein
VARVVRLGSRICIAAVDVFAHGARGARPFAQGRGVSSLAPLQRPAPPNDG